mmetsp:Transcript_34662/g.83802  ORF Transcript_34662/g.83802 Transcript_34662/m.83802 type:complete len:155 (-) Transcript_34662:723-1187(-)
MYLLLKPSKSTIHDDVIIAARIKYVSHPIQLSPPLPLRCHALRVHTLRVTAGSKKMTPPCNSICIIQEGTSDIPLIPLTRDNSGIPAAPEPSPASDDAADNAASAVAERLADRAARPAVGAVAPAAEAASAAGPPPPPAPGCDGACSRGTGRWR